MAKVFLSYRRNDTKWIAGRLFDHLAAHFGAGNVFMDVDNIPVGLDFRDHLQRVLTQCDILLAVVGPNWLTTNNAIPSTIDDEADWVRIEVGAALERQKPVVPLLIDGAKMPKAKSLPDDLRAFAFRQALSFDTEDFGNQIKRLTRSLDRLVAVTSEVKPPIVDVKSEPGVTDHVPLDPWARATAAMDDAGRSRAGSLSHQNKMTAPIPEPMVIKDSKKEEAEHLRVHDWDTKMRIFLVCLLSLFAFFTFSFLLSR
jgi:TIR domain